MPSWKVILDEVESYQRNAHEAVHRANTALDLVRSKYMKELHERLGRNVISYYSGFLSKPSRQSDINDEDLNGFMNAVHKLDRSLGLDLLLHTPGGSVASTLSIVNYLRQMFGSDIRAIVPQIAMSGGTMIACSCKSIIMAKHSQLGPTDPHLGGIPAAGVLREFKRACRESKNDPSKIPMWQAIVGQYRPTFLSQCDNAIKWANTFVEDQLATVMFSDLSAAKARKKAKAVVKKLTDYTGNKRHDKPIHFDECQSIGLKVSQLEDDQQTQDLVLSVHHCYMHAFMNGKAYKIIENHCGGTMVKNEPDTGERSRQR